MQWRVILRGKILDNFQRTFHEILDRFRIILIKFLSYPKFKYLGIWNPVEHSDINKLQTHSDAEPAVPHTRMWQRPDCSPREGHPDTHDSHKTEGRPLLGDYTRPTHARCKPRSQPCAPDWINTSNAQTSSKGTRIRRNVWAAWKNYEKDVQLEG